MMTHSNGERPGSGRAATGETAGSAGDSSPPPPFFILVMPLARFDNDANAPFSLEKAFSARIVPCLCRPGAFLPAPAVMREQGGGAFFARGTFCAGQGGEEDAGTLFRSRGESLRPSCLSPHKAPVPGPGPAVRGRRTKTPPRRSFDMRGLTVRRKAASPVALRVGRGRVLRKKSCGLTVREGK